MKDNNDKNSNKLKNHYSIIIIGVGISGLSTCIHLLNKMPDFIGKIAIVDPILKLSKSNEYKSNKGISEVPNDYIFKKYTPQFHYPKKLQETNSMKDFFTLNSINNKSNREKDLLEIVKKKGAIYYTGNIINLKNEEEIKTIELNIPTSNKDNDHDQASMKIIEITSNYLIDSYGILDNDISNEPKELEKLKNDYICLIINCNDSYSSSFAWCINYFHGNGYWIWCKPIEANQYSIGISYDKSIIKTSSINTIDSFISFLKNNCTILYNLIKSGDIIEFNKHTKKSNKTTTITISSDNWCEINEPTTINDPLYSDGMVLMAYKIQMICNLLYYKFIVRNDKEYKTRILLYNIGIKSISNNFNIGYKDLHNKNPSIMKSWKVYYETTIYFSFMFPIYFNSNSSLFKQLLNGFTNVYDNSLSCHNELLTLLKVETDKKILNSTITKSAVTSTITTKTKQHDKNLNIFNYFSNSNYYLMMKIINLHFKIYGFKCFLNSNFYKSIKNYSKKILTTLILSIIHTVSNFNNQKKVKLIIKIIKLII